MNKYKLSQYSFLCSYELPEGNINLIFSGRSGSLIRVDDNAYVNIESCHFEKIAPSSFETLCQKKIIVPAGENELLSINEENKDIFRHKVKDVLYLSTQPTSNCQFGCIYCGQKHQSYNTSFETMDKILARIEHKVAKTATRKLEIGWFGGEPLCALSQMRILNNGIKEICRKHTVEYTSHLTTNGYLLSAPIYNELVRQFNMRGIEITIDGDQRFHDKRRFLLNGKGSFNVIYANLLEIINSNNTMYPCMVSVRCNIDMQNIDGVIPLLEKMAHDNLQRKIVFYFTEVVSWAKNGAGANEKEKRIMSDKIIEIMHVMLKFGFQCPVLPQRTAPKYCMATSPESEMYDAYGNVFDCSEISYTDVYDNSGLILGSLSKNQSENKFARSILGEYKSMLLSGQIKECSQCKYYPLCGGGCPKGLHEKEFRCPSFIYNIEERMLLKYLMMNKAYFK